MKFLTILLLSATLAGCADAGAPVFNPPEPEQIASLLGYPPPVKLTRRIASAENLTVRRKEDGVPLAAFWYEDPEHTSESLRVTVFAAGTLFGDKRAEFHERIKAIPPLGNDVPPIGIFSAKDGRQVYQFPGAMGPGGATMLALLPCRDKRYELLLTLDINFHDDEDPKAYADHAVTKVQLHAVIEDIERLVFP